MTDIEKQNCLELRYGFSPTGQSQDERHRQWVTYVENSKLTRNEKDICIAEFMPSQADARRYYGRDV